MFTLQIKTANAAFSPDPQVELSRLLKLVAARLDDFHDQGPIMDANGNLVGEFELTDE